MRHEAFENLCGAIDGGADKHLKHIVTHEVGKIVACQLEDEFFEVELANGEHKAWSKENVREVD